MPLTYTKSCNIHNSWMRRVIYLVWSNDFENYVNFIHSVKSNVNSAPVKKDPYFPWGRDHCLNIYSLLPFIIPCCTTQCSYLCIQSFNMFYICFNMFHMFNIYTLTHILVLSVVSFLQLDPMYILYYLMPFSIVCEFNASICHKHRFRSPLYRVLPMLF